MDTGIEKTEGYGYTLMFFSPKGGEECVKGVVFAPNFTTAMQEICDTYGGDCIDMIRIWMLGDNLIELWELMEDKNFTEEGWLKKGEYDK